MKIINTDANRVMPLIFFVFVLGFFDQFGVGLYVVTKVAVQGQLVDYIVQVGDKFNCREVQQDVTGRL